MQWSLGILYFNYTLNCCEKRSLFYIQHVLFFHFLFFFFFNTNNYFLHFLVKEQKEKKNEEKEVTIFLMHFEHRIFFREFCSCEIDS